MIFFFLPLTVQSQERLLKGYIVTNSQDTISGFLFVPLSGSYKQTLQLSKTGLKKDVTRYNPTNTKSFHGENGYTLVSKATYVNGEEVYAFFEVLVSGKVTLLKTKLKSFDNRYFLEKDSKLYDLGVEKSDLMKTNTYILGVMNAVMGDCNEAKRQIEKRNNGKAKIAAVVKIYNEACGQHFESWKRREGLLLVPALFSGVSTSSLRLKPNSDSYNFLEGNFQSNIDPLFGFLVTASERSQPTRLAFTGGLIFIPRNYTLTQSITEFGLTESFFVEIKYNEFKLPFLVRYGFRGKKVSPYMDVGITATVNANRNLTNTFNGRPNARTFEISPSQFGFLVGAGIQKGLSSSLSIFIEIKGEITNGPVNEPFGSRHANLMLLTGIRF